MIVATRLSSHFSTNTRERGYQYFRRKRVRVERGTASELFAEVRGGETYEVVLKWTGDKVKVFCDCPYFVDQGRPCKHLWAAVLSADTAGHLSDIAAAPTIPDLDIDSLLAESDAEEQRAIRSLRSTAFDPPPPPKPGWKEQLDGLLKQPLPPEPVSRAWSAETEVLYIVNLADGGPNISLSLHLREPKKNGGWKKVRPLTLNRNSIEGIPRDEDRQILSMLIGSSQYGYYDYYGSLSRLSLSSTLADILVPRIVRTGRCYRSDSMEQDALRWDDGAAWKLVLSFNEAESSGWQVEGRFQRGAEHIALDATLRAIPSGFLLTREVVARLDPGTSMRWVRALSEGSPILIPSEYRDEFLARVLPSRDAPELALPPDFRVEEIQVSPRPTLKIFRDKYAYDPEILQAELEFDYAGRTIPERADARGIFDPPARRLLLRDKEAESAAVELMRAHGCRRTGAGWHSNAGWSIHGKKFPRLVPALLAAGWSVVAEGKSFRHAGKMSAWVSSGVDWFDLRGEVMFGETTAPLPQLLAALKRGETMIPLGDGSLGLLPEEWLRQFGSIADMGAIQGDSIRFSPGQAGLLDALLAAQPTIDCDDAFNHVRQELTRFQRIEPAEQPAGFSGTLREYQREGLGWMHFLRQFSFGGCLADDMGVGKTAQVLALLETRRAMRAQAIALEPSLVVVPRSLVFNWTQEAARFTPQMRILDHTGIGRNIDRFAEVDLILTTYGTLRRDVAHFRDVVFDYVVLDEAQAIKNSNTDSAKAVRLIQGRHRLALSGTPVENHLGELWSLFEFLNPGLLGSSSVFQRVGGAQRNPSEEIRRMLAHALRPFVLRRTKEQVVSELPAKVELTIYCELEARQRTLYNELRQHYRETLLSRTGSEDLSKAKIQVLEALLRLRQAACHPGLIDRALKSESSAKLDLLLEQLEDVLEGGHKALVFSQFTSLLEIVRGRLDDKCISHEYLDGKTKDRQRRVERFQNDADCRVFLISLKAGGVGLNLTAADYVFILDPWWNPAVEAQAIDRTHRIGQNRRVFAYRLIARGTVEEKVLALQETKRDLADAILGNNSSLIRELRREDLEVLLA